jgi:hypothetical protein
MYRLQYVVDNEMDVMMVVQYLLRNQLSYGQYLYKATSYGLIQISSTASI